jgi:diaminohydroxyphosphoribosylaminopyrimidine deaminase/5-amino-6-(5-phosphoribosylamino)uracil reductase
MPDEPQSNHMQRAIELARSVVGRTSPNPAVGAVLMKDGAIVGEGATQPSGQAHAEVMALRQAGGAAAGAELYVTLEPCPNFGRTPPCTQALIDAGVSSVHVATLDPNPAVAGGGVKVLEAAGVRVTVDSGSPEAEKLIEAFAKHITTGLPFVTAKFAMSLDGKIATRTGDSRWISNETSRRAAHLLRSEADAVMVGIGTALADDPLLSVRDVPFERAQPTRIVVDSTGRLPETAAMLAQDGSTLLAVANVDAAKRTALESAGVEIVAAPGSDARVDLVELLRLLGGRDITSILVEGGSGLLGSLFDAALVDKVVAFIAPVIIGGADAPSPVGGQGARTIADALRLAHVHYEVVDGDMMVVGYPEGSG